MFWKHFIWFWKYNHWWHLHTYHTNSSMWRQRFYEHLAFLHSWTLLYHFVCWSASCLKARLTTVSAGMFRGKGPIHSGFDLAETSDMWCIFLQQYRIHMDIGNSKNYLGIYLGVTSPWKCHENDTFWKQKHCLYGVCSSEQVVEDKQHGCWILTSYKHVMCSLKLNVLAVIYPMYLLQLIRSSVVTIRICIWSDVHIIYFMKLQHSRGHCISKRLMEFELS